MPPEGLRTTVESWEEAYRTFMVCLGVGMDQAGSSHLTKKA